MTLPLLVEIETGLTSVEAFDRFRDGPHPFFLDGGMDAPKLGRYSFMGAAPFLTVSSRGDAVTIRRGDSEQVITANPFEIVSSLLSEYRQDAAGSPLPFCGGAVGYFAYDLGRFVERLPDSAVDDLSLPECNFAFYDAILGYDNLEGKAYIAATGFPEKGKRARTARAEAAVAEIKRRLAGPAKTALPSSPVSAAGMSLKSGFTHEEYLAAVARARQYIIAGDIFEVNLSQRFEADLAIHPYELYRRLRAINPAPFACYQEFDELTVVSASPERFLKLNGDLVETRPIKGTRPRGQDMAADAALADELLASEKDRAENMMIVDLERNDLGRVCRYGSVRVTELAALEVFPTVFHLTSTVVGRLREGLGVKELLLATFPGGSITGAPKIRSMEIIDEIEPTRRSVYTGSIGYLGFNGDIDLNIAIRTIIVKGAKAYFQVGGAVVYDSDPEDEYQETLHKGRALLNALELSEAAV